MFCKALNLHFNLNLWQVAKYLPVSRAAAGFSDGEQDKARFNTRSQRITELSCRNSCNSYDFKSCM